MKKGDRVVVVRKNPTFGSLAGTVQKVFIGTRAGLVWVQFDNGTSGTVPEKDLRPE